MPAFWANPLRVPATDTLPCESKDSRTTSSSAGLVAQSSPPTKAMSSTPNWLILDKARRRDFAVCYRGYATRRQEPVNSAARVVRDKQLPGRPERDTVRTGWPRSSCRALDPRSGVMAYR